jgi:hypothetical protein
MTLTNNIYIYKTLTTHKPQTGSKHKTQFLKFTHNVELLVSQSAQLPEKQNKTKQNKFNLIQTSKSRKTRNKNTKISLIKEIRQWFLITSSLSWQTSQFMMIADDFAKVEPQILRSFFFQVKRLGK